MFRKKKKKNTFQCWWQGGILGFQSQPQVDAINLNFPSGINKYILFYSVLLYSPQLLNGLLNPWCPLIQLASWILNLFSCMSYPVFHLFFPCNECNECDLKALLHSAPDLTNKPWTESLCLSFCSLSCETDTVTFLPSNLFFLKLTFDFWFFF